MNKANHYKHIAFLSERFSEELSEMRDRKISDVYLDKHYELFDKLHDCVGMLEQDDSLHYTDEGRESINKLSIAVEKLLKLIKQELKT